VNKNWRGFLPVSRQYSLRAAYIFQAMVMGLTRLTLSPRWLPTMYAPVTRANARPLYGSGR